MLVERERIFVRGSQKKHRKQKPDFGKHGEVCSVKFKTLMSLLMCLLCWTALLWMMYVHVQLTTSMNHTNCHLHFIGKIYFIHQTFFLILLLFCKQLFLTDNLYFRCKYFLIFVYKAFSELYLIVFSLL